jgi:hypothetical protein
MPNAEPTFRGQLIIMRMMGSRIFLGECCTQWMPFSVDAVLGVCFSQYQLMIMRWRDREEFLNFVFCDDGWVVDETERDGGGRWEWCRGYKLIWEITGTTCQIGMGRRRLNVIIHWIRTYTCSIGDGQLTHTRNSLKSQFLMMISPISSRLSLSCPHLYHHLRTRS